jgi:autotransporter-associated beta strand protein
MFGSMFSLGKRKNAHKKSSRGANRYKSLTGKRLMIENLERRELLSIYTIQNGSQQSFNGDIQGNDVIYNYGDLTFTGNIYDNAKIYSYSDGSLTFSGNIHDHGAIYGYGNTSIVKNGDNNSSINDNGSIYQENAGGQDWYIDVYDNGSIILQTGSLDLSGDIWGGSVYSSLSGLEYSGNIHSGTFTIYCADNADLDVNLYQGGSLIMTNGSLCHLASDITPNITSGGYGNIIINDSYLFLDGYDINVGSLSGSGYVSDNNYRTDNAITIHSGSVTEPFTGTIYNIDHILLDGGTLPLVSGVLSNTSLTVSGNSTLQWCDNSDDISGQLTLQDCTNLTLDTNGNNVTLANGIGTSITKAGSGTLTIPSCSGGVTVNAGALIISGSISGNVANNSSLSIYGSVGGNVTNSGSIGIYGSVSGNITNSGSIGIYGSVSGNIANSGSLIFSNTTNTTCSGNITGTGSVTKYGAGALTLTGDNTYTGGTTISSGTLQIGNNGTSGSIIGDVTNNSYLNFYRSDNIMFDGVISGTGTLRKYGSGVLTLINDYTGSIYVSAGTVNKFKIADPDPLPINQGEDYELDIQAAFIVAPSSTQKEYAYYIDWGDGSSTEGTAGPYTSNGSQTAFTVKDILVPHTYGYAGLSWIQIGIWDINAEDAFVPLEQDLTVENIAPTLTIAENISVKQGQTLDLASSATFTDPGFAYPQGDPYFGEDFTYSIDWGDGQIDDYLWADNVTQGGPGVLTCGCIDATHVYDAVGSYSATLTLWDSGGGQDTAYFNVMVVKPSVSISGANAVGLGENYILTIGQVNDPGLDAVQYFTIHWGDGLEDIYTAAQIAQNNQVTHSYADSPGDKNISVDLTDDSGTYTDVAYTPNPFTIQISPFISSITELDFLGVIENTIHIANFGMAGPSGLLQITSQLPDNIVAAAILSTAVNSPGNGLIMCDPFPDELCGGFMLDVTAQFNGQTWTKSFYANFSSGAAVNMPPLFPIPNMEDPIYWPGNEAVFTSVNSIDVPFSHSFAAAALNNAALHYSIQKDGVYPPQATLDSSTGLFSCAFTAADAYMAYDFNIMVVDDEGYFDLMEVVMTVYVPDFGVASAISNTYAYVDPDSTTGVGLFVSSPSYMSNREFYLDGGPYHGRLNGNPALSDEITYIPNPGYRGPDKINYHWTYDLCDNDGNVVQAGVSTYMKSAYIEVGPFCSLEADGAEVVDGKYVLGVGQTTTVDLTLHSPRHEGPGGDGDPVWGIWSLNFNPGDIKVYYNGEEIMPLQQRLIQGLSIAQTKTLTVKCLTPGEATITAYWDIYTSPNAPGIYQYGVYAIDCLELWLVGADIDTDSNNDGSIDYRNGPLGTDDKIEELAPGRILAVHETGANDLAEVDLGVNGVMATAADQYYAKLSLSNDNVSLWYDSAGTVPIVLQTGGFALWDLFADANSLPSSIYVKGLEVGASSITWSVLAGTQLLSTDVVADTTIDIKSLTVKDHSNAARSATSSSATAPIKDVYAAVNYADGYMHIDLSATVAGFKAADHIRWSIGGDIPAGSDGKTSINDVKLRAGDYVIQVWLDTNPAKKIQINVHRFWTFTEECAVLSDAAYGGNVTLPPEWGAVGPPCTGPAGKAHATLFYKPSTRQYVLAFKGTTITSIDDLRADIQQNYTYSDMYDDAVRLAEKVIHDYSVNGGVVSFTGHSLGGGLASLAALVTQHYAVTFNAASLSDKIILLYPSLNFDHLNDQSINIDSWFISGEAITEFQDQMSQEFNFKLKRPGRKHVMRPPKGITGPFELHEIKSVEKSLYIIPQE